VQVPEKVLYSNILLLLGVSKPVQHIRHFWDKMVGHSRNGPVLCFTFPVSLKGVASDWFYSLPPHSLHNFTEVIETFLTYYAFRQEIKRNNHHLLFVKMMQGDRLKSYLNFFQNQLKVSKCGEEVAALACISRLQVAHPLYKHLLKHNIGKMSEILIRAQPYIQFEEAMKASSDHLAKPSDGVGKSKSPREAPDHP